MARIYKTKGDAAKTHRLTVTMTASLYERIERRAVELRCDKAATVRRMVEAGLSAGDSFVGEEKVVA